MLIDGAFQGKACDSSDSRGEILGGEDIDEIMIEISGFRIG